MSKHFLAKMPLDEDSEWIVEV